MKVKHVDGKKNLVADIWSRICALTSTLTLEQIHDTLSSLDNLIKNDANIAHVLATLTPNRVVRGPRTVYSAPPLTNKIYKYIAKCHNHVIGHGGVERTLTRLSQLVPYEQHWRSMRKDVCTFIRQCPCCIFMQPSKSHCNSLTEIFENCFKVANYKTRGICYFQISREARILTERKGV